MRGTMSVVSHTESTPANKGVVMSTAESSAVKTTSKRVLDLSDDNEDQYLENVFASGVKTPKLTVESETFVGTSSVLLPVKIEPKE